MNLPRFLRYARLRVVMAVMHRMASATAAIQRWHDKHHPTQTSMPPHMSSADGQKRVFETLRLLIPLDLVGVAKRRVGGSDDGGYVMVDCITPAQPILSIGVGPDVSFDFELAQQGHTIVMFDHTVANLPTQHPNFTWHRLGVAAVTEPNGVLRSLEDLADMLPNTGADPILKMDVEGAEWGAFEGASPATLRRFAQISLELHDMENIGEPVFNARVTGVLQKLLVDFVVVHVHANNCATLGYAGGFAVPDCLEITLIRRDLATTAPSQTWYPTNLDCSNWRGGVDFPLWQFPFAPGSDRLELATLQA